MRHVVAITTLATTVDDEAKALAAELGTTAYEQRLKLTAGLPAIVLATTDAAAAHALHAKLKARGHRAHVVRAADVIAASAMIQLRHFAFEEEALVSGAERLPWSAITTLVRARHHHRSETTAVVKEKKFNATRAILSGGLVTRKTERREVVTRSEDSEQVLYLFRGDGAPPWLLREQATNYAALGATLAPTANRNFATAIELFRARAPDARFDDSLLRRPTIDDVDLFAHLLALAR
jgi:hypothetical protein